MNNEFGMGFNMGFGWLLPVMIIGVLFYILKNGSNSKDTFSAQDILDKRYANGGIDKEEYEEKSRHLSEHA